MATSALQPQRVPLGSITLAGSRSQIPVYITWEWYRALQLLERGGTNGGGGGSSSVAAADVSIVDSEHNYPGSNVEAALAYVPNLIAAALAGYIDADALADALANLPPPPLTGFAPLSTGGEPLVLVSDGQGQCVMVPYS